MKVTVIVWPTINVMKKVGHAAMKIRAEGYRGLKININRLNEAKQKLQRELMNSPRLDMKVKEAVLLNQEMPDDDTGGFHDLEDWSTINDYQDVVRKLEEAVGERDGPNNVYISWWPAEDCTTGPLGCIAVRVPRLREQNYKLEKGWENPTYGAPKKVEMTLRGTHEGGTHYAGLDVVKLLDWWRNFDKDEGTYKLHETDCCRVVGKALTAAGARIYSYPDPDPETALAYIPTKSWEWALQIQARIEKVDGILRDWEAQLQVDIGNIPQLRVDQIDSLSDRVSTSDQWWHDTRVKIGHRKEEWTSVDGLLNRYHGYRNGDRGQRKKVLLEIIDQTHAILAHAKHNTRFGHVQQLYKQVRLAYEAINTGRGRS